MDFRMAVNTRAIVDSLQRECCDLENGDIEVQRPNGIKHGSAIAKNDVRHWKIIF